MNVDQKATRYLAQRGYLLDDGMVWMVTNDDEERGLEEQPILHWPSDDPLGAYMTMMAQSFPTEPHSCPECDWSRV